MPLADSVKVFTVPQADVLASCVVRAHDTLATRSDMHELRVAMTELAVQQKETSKELKELASTGSPPARRSRRPSGHRVGYRVDSTLRP